MADVYREVVELATSNQASKYATIAARLQQPGPPLHLALEHIALPSHRSALSSLLCGDWFLAVHAHNYFARNLVPQTATQINRVLEAGGAANTICLACWHHRREAFLEDEFHVLCVCPEYAGARRDFIITGATLNHHLDMMQILQCRNKVQAEHLATFLIRTRQTRRKLKVEFESLNDAVTKKSFVAKRAAWRFRGRACCRHGVLFITMPLNGCRCMAVSNSTEGEWAQARFMPALNHLLEFVGAVPFDIKFQRLSQVQRRARTLGW